MWKKTSGKIQLCEHCGDKAVGSGRFCNDCKTAEGRRQMDEANVKHFKENGLEYNCEYCENVAKKRKEKVEREKLYPDIKEPLTN